MSVHRLYGELAASFVRYTAPDGLCAIAGADLDIFPASCFEGACAMLRKLRVAYHPGLDGPGVYSASNSTKLAIDANRVAQFVTDLSRTGEIPLPPIDEVLAAWVSRAANPGHVWVRRDPFVPHADSKPVIALLVELGYAKAYGDSVLWTDKMAPAMGLWWDENNLSHEEAEEREIDLDMRKALASIPEDVRHMALRDNVIGVLKALQARWVDGAWLADADTERPLWAVPHLVAAKRLVELVQDAGAVSVTDLN